jgi:hypothetical protein
VVDLQPRLDMKDKYMVVASSGRIELNLQ